MKKLRTIIVIVMLSTLFCIGCSKKDAGNSTETQQQHSENDGHDHSEHDGHDH